MNGRFKFRVWNKKLEKYLDPHEVSVSPDGFLFYDELIFNVSNDILIIEQCTGLKDKNGNLIYENDLVKTANYKTGLPEIYAVKWCDECGLYQLESTQSDQIIDMYRAEKGIICGNIHEIKGE